MYRFKHIPALLFFLAMQSSFAQVTSELQDYNLKGKVKTLVAQEWLAKDSAGQPVKIKPIIPYGLFGQLTTYNENGFPVRRQNLDSMRIKKTRSYTYDDLNEPILLVERNGNGSETVHRYTYEQQGNMRITYMQPGEGPAAKVQEMVAENGKMVKRLSYEDGDTLAFNETFTYNTDGTMALYTIDYRSGRRETFSWQWKKGQKTQGLKTVYENGQKTKGIMYFYDSNGSVTRETESDYRNLSRQHVVTYEYTYDQKGNWITRKRTERENNRVLGIYIAERTITYY